MAYVNLEQASNYAAKSWLEQQDDLQLPLDSRPLRDKQGESGNIVSYQRRGKGGVRLTPPAVGAEEVIYIGEDTPPPKMPSG